MTTTCTTNEPLDFGASDPSTFETCIFLVNVLSHMYDQWVNAGSPTDPDDFPWLSGGDTPNTRPTDVCPVTMAHFDVNDFAFGSLIWSTFTYEFTNPITGKVTEKTVTEPFGSLVQSNTDGSLYLVFRGSKSLADFAVDAQTSPVAYTAPTSNPPSDIQVETGWYNVYNGLLDALRTKLNFLSGQQVTITGHSLGSTLATLAVPEAVANSVEVRHYNSASPKVGYQSFATYYESLTAVSETFRLVNTADKVPNFPSSSEYVHVGTQISFNADYGDEKKNHDPCCSYAYAVFNPDSPCNPGYDDCANQL